MGNALPHLMASSISPCKPQPVEFNAAEFAESHILQSRAKQKSNKKESLKGKSPNVSSNSVDVAHLSNSTLGITEITPETDGYVEPTAFGSVQNITFKNTGMGSTDLYHENYNQMTEGFGHTDYDDYVSESEQSHGDKGWTTNHCHSAMDRHDAMYNDHSEIEDLLFKLSMEDTLRIAREMSETSREGSVPVWFLIFYLLIYWVFPLCFLHNILCFDIYPIPMYYDQIPH